MPRSTTTRKVEDLLSGHILESDGALDRVLGVRVEKETVYLTTERMREAAFEVGTVMPVFY